MHLQAQAVLRQIGAQLDQDIFPRVKNGGIVTPSGAAVPFTLGAEQHNETRRPRKQRGPATGSWEGPSGREGPAGRPRSSRQTTSFLSPSLQTHYEAELDAVRGAYPGAQVWQQEGGLWLLTESSLLPNLGETAIFLTGISYRLGSVRGWGFWRGSLIGPAWIGPRHTNFPDGSICAFALADGTWMMGDPIVELLDLYTVWAVRHLHLKQFGRWPGGQEVLHPYERITELRADERCGCGAPGKLYGDCCRDEDFRRNRVADTINFLLRAWDGSRRPPSPVIKFLLEQTAPPRLSELFAQ